MEEGKAAMEQMYVGSTLVSALEVTPTDCWLNSSQNITHKIGNTSGVSKSSSDWFNYTGFLGDVYHVL